MSGGHKTYFFLDFYPPQHPLDTTLLSVLEADCQRDRGVVPGFLQELQSIKQNDVFYKTYIDQSGTRNVVRILRERCFEYATELQNRYLQEKARRYLHRCLRLAMRSNAEAGLDLVMQFVGEVEPAFLYLVLDLDMS